MNGSMDVTLLATLLVATSLAGGGLLLARWRHRPSSFTIRDALVIDGDTIWHGGQKIRLIGIDAPEIDTADGRRAKKHLEGLLAGRLIRVLPKGHDQYGRLLAVLWTGKGDVCKAMVEAGFAIASRYETQYARVMRDAERSRRGLWRHGPIADPAAHRRATRQRSAA